MHVVSEPTARALTAPPRIDVMGEANFKAMVNGFVAQYTAHRGAPAPAALHTTCATRCEQHMLTIAHSDTTGSSCKDLCLSPSLSFIRSHTCSKQEMLSTATP